jgi:hypothetical protein
MDEDTVDLVIDEIAAAYKIPKRLLLGPPALTAEEEMMVNRYHAAFLINEE